MHGFDLIDEHPVPALAIVLHRYRHRSGALHCHLASDDVHRACAIAFRTAPVDDTGLPHILEHLSLCGSRRFPVRDPFFMMLRRSLQTFMNAFTYPDMTCYPFATQVGKDFDNLLAIYLDAVFAPRLDRLDFAQEGWRLVPEGETWAFQGVVYNEMKGAMGDTDAQLFDRLGRTLFPDTCYRFNSGGDPGAIPDLDYDQLVAFHRARYGAANACISTYGRLPIDDLHARFDNYLEAHPGSPVAAQTPQPPLVLDATIEVPVPYDPAQDPRDVSAASLNWCWADSADIDESLEAELIDRLLTSHAAAPLRLALDSSGLGRSCAGTGYTGFLRNGLFCAEMAGIAPEDYARFQPLVTNTLEEIAAHGFASDEVDAALDQLEMARRHIGGDNLPFGLQLCLRCIKSWNHDGDVVQAIDQDAAIARLRRRHADDGTALAAAIDERLLANQHRALFLAIPDREFHDRFRERERARIDARLTALNTDQQDALRDQARALSAHQQTTADPACLPELLISDIPTQRGWPDYTVRDDGPASFTCATNGILSCFAAIPLDGLDREDLLLLPGISGSIGQLGFADHDYRGAAQLLNRSCMSLAAWHFLSQDPDGGACRGYLVLEVHGLADRRDEFLGHLPAILAGQRFDEHGRMRELTQQALADLQQGVLSQGHGLAVAAAARAMPGRAGLGHTMHGLGRLPILRRRLHEDDGIAANGAALSRLLARVRAGPIHLAVVGDRADEAVDDARRAWDGFDLRAPAVSATPLALPAADPPPPTAFTTSSPINFCAMSLPAPALDHPDAPALTVAGFHLAHQVLHPRIREQGGAYGSSARYAANKEQFALSTYRDPRLAGSFDDMRAALTGLASYADDDRALREAILSAIAGIDHPGSPAGEARRRFLGELQGTGPKRIDALRAGVLQVTCADLRRVAQTWLDPARATLAVVTAPGTCAAQGLDWAEVAI